MFSVKESEIQIPVIVVLKWRYNEYKPLPLLFLSDSLHNTFYFSVAENFISVGVSNVAWAVGKSRYVSFSSSSVNKPGGALFRGRLQDTRAARGQAGLDHV